MYHMRTAASGFGCEAFGDACQPLLAAAAGFSDGGLL
jgi:hypothetical protein